jgi:hypothetical protein
MYLACGSTLNNGGENQNLADVASGILVRLKLVKSVDKEKAIATAAAKDVDEDKDEDKDKDNAAAANAGKGMRVLLELTEPWHHSDCLVTANVYFASMEAALAMKEKGLYFISNVKQCSRRFLMEILSNTTLSK